MKYCNILIVLILLHTNITAQRSDFLLLKKKDRVMKSYYSGSSISFGTASGNFSGIITAIHRDSVFFRQYDIRQMLSNLGVYILDTLAVYDMAFNYHDMLTIGKKQRGFNLAASGTALFGGGALLTTCGLITWLVTKPGTRYHASSGLVFGSAAFTGAGYLLMRSGNSHKLGLKYFLEYIPTGK